MERDKPASVLSLHDSRSPFLGELFVFAATAALKECPLGAQARAAGEKAGFSLVRDPETGPELVAFSAALQYDYNI